MKTTILLAAALAAAAAPAMAADCAALYRQHLATDLKLSYERFDQTPGGGFRVLAGQRCYKEAGDLLEDWMHANRKDDESVRWHLAQQRALQGDYPEAIHWARGTLDVHEDVARIRLHWNDYVLATIAFLQHDKPALLAARERVAAGAMVSDGDAVNLKFVDSMVKNFDASYAVASEGIVK